MEDKNILKIAATLKWAIIGVITFVVLILAFTLGVWTGFEKAQSSFRWAENYHRNFGGPRGGFFADFPGRGFTDGHGVFGKVIKIDGDTILMQGNDNMEKTIKISSKTAILDGPNNIEASDLKVDSRIMVIGMPDETGETEAKLIRVFPPESFENNF